MQQFYNIMKADVCKITSFYYKKKVERIIRLSRFNNVYIRMKLNVAFTEGVAIDQRA